jgi:hypothetical protein
MSNLAPIYDPWGGNAEAMAADIEEKPITVRKWRNRGNIPVSYWPRITAEAAKRGSTLTNDMFVAAMVPSMEPVSEAEAA